MKIYTSQPNTTGGKFAAHLNQRETFAFGRTLEEAIGALILAHGGKCGIDVLPVERKMMARRADEEYLAVAKKWVASAKKVLSGEAEA